VRLLLRDSRQPIPVSGGSLGPRRLLISGRDSQVRLDGRPIGPVFQIRADPARGDWIEVAGQRIRGALEARASARSVRLIEVLPLEDYVAGVVAGELPHSFADEALKAQAVAARSYALHRIGRAGSSERAQFLPTTADQVYRATGSDRPRIRDAVRATRGEFLSYRGEAILAAYHASSGGRTAAADEVWRKSLPYLVSQPVCGEEVAPDSYWRAKVSRTTLGRALAPLGVHVGALRSLSVDEWSASGRAARVWVRGSRGERGVDATALRRALGEERIRSTRFEIEATEDGFVFTGAGFGHGVGMSQWGAEAMARDGANYREILSHFYPGTRIERAVPSVSAGRP
jgi:stage II sporulation protein D